MGSFYFCGRNCYSLPNISMLTTEQNRKVSICWPQSWPEGSRRSPSSSSSSSRWREKEMEKSVAGEVVFQLLLQPRYFLLLLLVPRNQFRTRGKLSVCCRGLPYLEFSRTTFQQTLHCFQTDYLNKRWNVVFSLFNIAKCRPIPYFHVGQPCRRRCPSLNCPIVSVSSVTSVWNGQEVHFLTLYIFGQRKCDSYVT